ncbi:SNF2 family N-terminal domain-containing protein [Chytridium lagenaria]|nr:SNF2 family N-terminal domain-containing protein [Chytridium lagenaria]
MQPYQQQQFNSHQQQSPIQQYPPQNPAFHPQQFLAQQHQQQNPPQQQLPQQQLPQQQLPQQQPLFPNSIEIPTQPPSPPITAFSTEQREALRNQIYAYKVLSNASNLTEGLMKSIFESKYARTDLSGKPLPGFQDRDQSSPVVVTPSTAGLIASSPLFPNPYRQIQTEAEEVFETNEDGSRKIVILPIREHALFNPKILIPSVMPPGIDPYELSEERERRIQFRVFNRIYELENILTQEGKDILLPPNGSNEIKQLIELKSLKLLDRQKALRKELTARHRQQTLLLCGVDSNMYVRPRRQTLQHIALFEKLEMEQKLEKERMDRQARADYCAHILLHGREFFAAHRNHESAEARLGSAVLRFHANAEKEEQKRLQRLQQDRLNALKANDEEAYLKLIDQAKDTRITQILGQTQQYLSNLTANIASQQEDVPMMSDEVLATMEVESSNDYYSSAHKIRETVTEQSGLLIGGRLKEYQIKGLQWMVSLYNNRLNGILADEMGLGKTIQTISLITYLIEKKKQLGPYLIIVPLGTITNWMVEFEKWAPGVAKIVFKGVPSERKRLAAEIKQGNFNVLLTTYEYIINERPLLCKIKWVYMIIDEGHRMKNAQSKLSVTLMQHYSSRYRVLLTGTPLQNNLPELWALLNFILPKVFNSIQSFDEWFSSPFSNAGSAAGTSDLSEEERLLMIKGLHKALRPFLLRRLKKDVESELPDKVETIIKCPMSALQKKITEWVRTFKTIGPFDVKGTRTLSNIVMQFRKICNHPFVFPEVEELVLPGETLTNEMIYRSSGKFELLDRILPKLFKTGHRVLMFFQMTQVMDIIEDFFRFRGWKFLRMDGNIKSDNRGDLLKDFNAKDSEYDLFILSTRAGGLGLNLQTADTVVIFDSDWNPHQDLQAQDRAHRIGQTKEVRIFRLITTNSIEEHILAKAQQKLDLDGKVIQAGKFDQKTSEKEREELLRLLFSSEKEEVAEGNEDAPELTDEQLNEILARGADELEIFAQMDQERVEAEKARGALPRLMTEDELPQQYKVDLSKVPREKKELEVGPRERKQVRYNEVLTEEQWLDAVEEGDLELAIQKKEEKLERRQRRKIAKVGSKMEESDNDDNDEDYQSSEEEVAPPPIPMKRGRGRPRKNEVVVKKKQRSESPEKEIKRRGRKPKPRVVEEDKIDAGKRRGLKRVFEAVLKANFPIPIGHFQVSTVKRWYKDYYAIITDPIALDTIEERAQGIRYSSIEDFMVDIRLMVKNARTYNQEGSAIVVDALEIEKIVVETFAKHAPDGVIADEPDPSPATAPAPRKRTLLISDDEDPDSDATPVRGAGRRKQNSDSDDSVAKRKRRKPESESESDSDSESESDDAPAPTRRRKKDSDSEEETVRKRKARKAVSDSSESEEDRGARRRRPVSARGRRVSEGASRLVIGKAKMTPKERPVLPFEKRELPKLKIKRRDPNASSEAESPTKSMSEMDAMGGKMGRWRIRIGRRGKF